jgi:cobalt/nickel transport system permease protein
MHIADGILPAPVVLGGFAASAAAVTIAVRRFDEARIPELGVVTSLFFVGSLVHLPLPGTSIHLLLNGLTGIVLGWLSFPSILVGLFFQAILLFHGGIAALGVNAAVLGGGALASSAVFHGLRRLHRSRLLAAAAAVVATAAAYLTSGLLYILAMLTGGSQLGELAEFVFLFHLLAVAIEAVVTAFTVSFLLKVKPELLERRPRRAVSMP